MYLEVKIAPQLCNVDIVVRIEMLENDIDDDDMSSINQTLKLKLLEQRNKMDFEYDNSDDRIFHDGDCEIETFKKSISHLDLNPCRGMVIRQH